MDAERERDLFGPKNPFVLTLQHMHRSRMVSITREQEKTLLTTYKGGAGVFWTYRDDDPTYSRKVALHPRVVDKLSVMGFYGPLRCGSFRLDRHLITALVERWRPETHTFHFPIGEATITLQDIAIIWGLPIEGDPIICNDRKRSFEEWQMLCRRLLGFELRERDMRNKSAILLSFLNNYVKNSVVINENTPQDVVDQYARGCALLLLGTLMMPDITGDSVPLVYLLFLEDVNKAYSWGSAVLATLYRELCTASHADRISIAGPLHVLQIWAWSRIRPIQPLNVGEMLVQGRLAGVDNRELGLPPYGARWIQHHDLTESVSHAVRLYRDIFDRLSNEQFIWEPYDMQSLEITTLGPCCLTENWRSQCPLINIAMVELHYPNRVLRQFGMVQNIPADVETQDQMKLHNDTRKGKSGFDWTRRHNKWIELWGIRQPFVPTRRINGGVSTTNDYMQWYNQITRRLISPDQYTVEVRGFQPPRTSTQDILVQWISKLKISINNVRMDNTSSMRIFLDTVREFISEVEPIMEIPPYLVDPPPPISNREAEQDTRRQGRMSYAVREDVGPSTSRVRRRHSSVAQEESP